MDRKTGEAKVTFDISRTFRVPYVLIFFQLSVLVIQPEATITCVGMFYRLLKPSGEQASELSPITVFISSLQRRLRFSFPCKVRSWDFDIAYFILMKISPSLSISGPCC